MIALVIAPLVATDPGIRVCDEMEKGAFTTWNAARIALRNKKRAPKSAFL